MKVINLYALPDEVMLIIEHPSGVLYENQVGGVVCWQASIEGVLTPLDLPTNAVQKIIELPYLDGRGISSELADAVDSALAGTYVKVDRARIADSFEAWIFVVAEISETSDEEPRHFGAPRGFGRSAGVLTWPNSD